MKKIKEHHSFLNFFIYSQLKNPLKYKVRQRLLKMTKLQGFLYKSFRTNIAFVIMKSLVSLYNIYLPVYAPEIVFYKYENVASIKTTYGIEFF